METLKGFGGWRTLSGFTYPSLSYRRKLCMGG
jgi:hypothetical protein